MNPDLIDILPAEIEQLVTEKRFQEAVPLLEEWAAENPSSQNLRLLAETCREAGAANASANYFLQALKQDEEDPENWDRLIAQILLLGDLDAAFEFTQMGLEKFPENNRLLGKAHQILEKLDLSQAPTELLSFLECLLTRLASKPQMFYPYAAAALQERLADWADKMGENTLREASENGLLLAILDECLIQSVELEEFILTTRQYICRNYDRLHQTANFDLERLILSLANQCLSAEYVFSIGAPDEIQAVDALNAIQIPDDSNQWSRIGLMACYKPIYRQFSEQRLPSRDELKDVSSHRRDFLKRHWLEPRSEEKIAESISSLGQVRDAVSIKVSLQYEEAPYPRWRHAAKPVPRSFREDIRRQLPSCPEWELPPESLDRPSVLIAGCGTGQHSALAALSNPDAQITAIDLSRRSLAYAKRKGDELGVANIEYFQADILEIEQLNQQFDVIETMGVLHHMADPDLGWKKLTDMLKPGGFMKVGLYSRLARSRLEEAQQIASATTGPSQLARIRSFRDKVKWSPDFPFEIRRELLSAYDFYSLGGCHDLLFHVQERSYKLTEIKEKLDRLDLNFIGFQLSHPKIWELYNREFPDDSEQMSLDNWDSLEQRYPGIFSSMYAFWVKKSIQGGKADIS